MLLKQKRSCHAEIENWGNFYKISKIPSRCKWVVMSIVGLLYFCFSVKRADDSPAPEIPYFGLKYFCGGQEGLSTLAQLLLVLQGISNFHTTQCL
jgi:hypothetical protein